MECTDELFRTHGLKFHWLWIKLPMVKAVAKPIDMELIRVQPMEVPNNLIFNLEFTDEPCIFKFGELGHAFLYGFYIVNEEGEKIYISQNEKEYYDTAERFKKFESERNI